MLDVPRPQENKPVIEHRTNWLRSLADGFNGGRSLGRGAALLRRISFRAILILGVIGALGYFGAPIVLGPIISVDTVIRGDFNQSVVASGRVETPFRVNVGSQITGIVADIPVAEGQAVTAGQVLIVLDDREARAAVVQAESAVAQAEARLRQIRELTLPSAEEGLKQATATLINAQKSHDRVAKLVQSGASTQVTLDEATKSLDIALALVRNAEFQVYTNRPGGSDYVLAETQLNQNRASLTVAQSRLSYTVIRAPRDGILISRDVERGNIVQPSNVLMRLSPAGDTQLVVQIDEKNLGLIAVGQKALASADAFARERFAAEVAYINPGIALQRASVEVKLRVPDPPTYLRQDMTVSVDIEVAMHPNALIMPQTSLRGAAAGRPWVLKVSGGHVMRQLIKIGIVSAGKVEILDGLEAGDFVVPSTYSLANGTRVRTRVSRQTSND